MVMKESSENKGEWEYLLLDRTIGSSLQVMPSGAGDQGHEVLGMSWKKSQALLTKGKPPVQAAEPRQHPAQAGHLPVVF